MAWEISRQTPRAVGVYTAGGILYLVEVVAAGDGFEIRQAFRRTVVQDNTEPTMAGSRLAEEIKLLCLTHGLSRRVGLVVSREECYIYERVYPSLDRKELAQAIPWDIAVNCPFAGQQYWTGFSAREGRVLAAVLDEERGLARWQAFREAGLEVGEIFLAPEELLARPAADAVCLGDMVFFRNARTRDEEWSEEMTLALYGAANVLRPGQEGAIGFLPEDFRPEKRAWLSYAVGLAVITVCLMAEVFLINLWLLREADQRLEEARQRYDWTADARQQVATIQQLRAETEALDEALIQLSAGRRSWYYAFYVLGLLNVEDVWLTHFEPAEDGYLRCRGEASSYGALMEYFSLFEDNSALLSAPPVLEHFEQAEPGSLSFTMKLRF